jgi:uncharacterized protein (TIGR03435 family)
MAFGQQSQPRPAFEIADVHVSPRSDWVKNVTHPFQGGYLAADRYELRRATMLDMIKLAYEVDADKVTGGPSWLDYDRFEVVAKAPRGTRPETLRLMLQSLLDDRFHLVMKSGAEDVPAHILTVGKRELKLKASSGTSPLAGCRTAIVINGDTPNATLTCTHATMESFARALRGRLGDNLPVVNATGLDGEFDFDMQMPANSQSQGPPPALLAELDKLGLKIEPGKTQQPVLAVVSVNEQPTANSPDLTRVLPPLPPPQFEVASLKIPCEGNATIAPKFETGGRVTATCMPPMGLIRDAWGLMPFQEAPGAPKWLMDGGTSHNVSVVAKAPAGVAPDPQHSQMARDIVHQMLRALLIERYQMKIHYEERPMDTHTLVAVKPKLTKADPAGRTGCTRLSAPGQQTTRLVCKNMTMTQFAEQMQAYDSEIYYPVVDATGVEGAWDFTIQYDPLVSLRARFPSVGRGASPSGEAADPGGSLSFQAAIEKQLGLKVEIRKRPQQVLVIDQMAEKPIEN